MNRSKSTISEEVRRGRYNGKYRAEISHKRALRNRKESHKHSKRMDTKLLHFIEWRLKKKWSPEIISHALSEKGVEFSHTSIYNVIKKHRPKWRKLLIHRRKYKRSKGYVEKISNRTGIEKRPEIVNRRRRFGDWEVDTALSCRGGKACLAVFVERKTRLYRLAKMRDREMLAATIRTLKNQEVKTMTYDNGTENANHELANNILNCKSFFCNAYHSWEKGSIDNRNKILRQFFPKGTNFDLISEKEIRRVQNEINNRPMKALNWHSPAEVFKLIRSGY